MEPSAATTARQRARMRARLRRLPARRTPLDSLVLLVVRAGFAAVGWRIRVEGVASLPRDAAGRVVPCVVAVAPHRGWIDPFLLLLAWPRGAPRLAWFGDEGTMTSAAWRRRLLPRLGLVPVPPSPTLGAIREHLADARAVLGRGCCLVVFPEKGPPSPRSLTRTISPGVAWLAAAAGVPIVPVALGGFLEAGLGTRYRLRFLPPLPPPRTPPDTAAGRAEARAATADLATALAPAVKELETWSARVNGRRPLPWLRDVFH